MANIVQIASQTIASPDGGFVLVKDKGKTKDIIAEIINVEKLPATKNDTKKFAHNLRENSIEDTLYNIWSFVRHKIKYIIDESGKQFIKTPSRIWADGFADCKGKSIFISSLLQNLGINSYGYRFASYGLRPVYTHVYIYVTYDGKEYILDSVMNEFNKEKPYKFKKDIPMTQIYRLSGIGRQRNTGQSGRQRNAGSSSRQRNTPASGSKRMINFGYKTPDQMTDAEMDLWLARDRMKTEQAIVKKRGRNLKAEKYQDSIDMLEDAIEVVQKHTRPGVRGNDDVIDELMEIADDAVSGVYSIASSISGIGAAKKKAVRKKKKAERKEKRQVRKEEKKQVKAEGGKKAVKEWRKSSGTKTGKFLQKVGQKAAKGAKAVAKVATAPQRLAVKGLLEVTLPSAAPFFLYLFVTDPGMVAKLPSDAKKKREKSKKLAKFIVEGIGMKESHFMAIIRNGIMKKFGKSPETVISEQMKGIAGIGAYAAVVGVAFKAVKKIIEIVSKLFKKKLDVDISEEDFPDPSSQKERAPDVADQIEVFANKNIDQENDDEGEYGEYDEQKERDDSDSYDATDQRMRSSGGPRKVWSSF